MFIKEELDNVRVDWTSVSVGGYPLWVQEELRISLYHYAGSYYYSGGGLLMYFCMLCGERLLWQCDYNPEDLGYVGIGMVNVCHCLGCKVDYEVVCIEGENPMIQIVKEECQW